MVDIEFETENKTPLKLYTKTCIFWTSFFLSIIGGGILFSINLWRIGKKNIIPYIILIVAALKTISIVLVYYSKYFFDDYLLYPKTTNTTITFLTELLIPRVSSLVSLMFLFVSNYVLNYILWNKFVGKDIEFEKEPWVKLFVIILTITLVLSLIILITTKYIFL